MSHRRHGVRIAAHLWTVMHGAIQEGEGISYDAAAADGIRFATSSA